MAFVYVVTSGEYSDYGIEAVFSTEEAARAFADIEDEDRWGDPRIEVWPLDNPDGTGERRPWRVQMWYATGDVIEASPENTWVLDDPDDEPRVIRNDPQRFIATVRASTKEQAIKAANERRAMHKAHSLNASTASS